VRKGVERDREVYDTRGGRRGEDVEGCSPRRRASSPPEALSAYELTDRVIARARQTELDSGLADLAPGLGRRRTIAIEADDESVEARISAWDREVHELSLPTLGASMITIS
jgi:hypothetical protein